MLKTLFITWLKNVNNLRKTSSTTIGQISTNRLRGLHKQYTNWLQRRFSKLFTTLLSTYLFTPIKDNFHLLNKSFTHNPQHLLLRLKNEI